MLLPVVLKSWLQRATFGSVLIALISIATPASSQSTGIDPDHQKTATPIKHVIVLIGENRTFDHVFATYVPRGGDSPDHGRLGTTGRTHKGRNGFLRRR
jgi:phospholipase C